MATVSGPIYSAAKAGVVGAAAATARPSQMNQFLTTHPGIPVYQGKAIATPSGAAGDGWVFHFDQFDYDQPFTMSGTTVGRVVIPLLPTGNGADLVVSLCADNAGAPGTVLARTRIPKSWINQLAAVSATAGPSTSPNLQYTDNPLALAQFNTLFGSGVSTASWPYPAASSAGTAASNPQSAYSGNYLIQCGGTNGAGALVADVFTIQYTGGTTLQPAVPQPSMPMANGSAAAVTVTNNPNDTTNTIVVAGGGSPVTAAVFTASFDPNTGIVSSWSSQAALPQALYNAASTAWNDFVYVVGGTNSGGITALNTVYYASVSNGQITGWATATLPASVELLYSCVCNGLLFAIAGSTASGNVSAVYYAPLDPSTGKPGAWRPGPALPAAATSVANDNCMSTPSGILVRANGTMYSLGVTSSGPAPTWYSQIIPTVADDALFPVGDGQWQWFEVYATGYFSSTFYLTPTISVPLPATGLTSGATYHVLMQQPGGGLTDYLWTFIDFDALPGNPTVLFRTKGSHSWTAETSGFCIPISVYDDSVTGPLWHLWADNGARITTIVNTSTPGLYPVGLCEATAIRTAMNHNTGFESGTAPWAATDAALTQSNAQSHEGTYSAELVATGGFASCFMTSETLTALPGVSYTLETWVYSPGGYGSIQLALSWYDVNSALISTSAETVSVSAATWTRLSFSVSAPASTAALTAQLGQTGSPASGQTTYWDASIIYETYGGQQASNVAQIEYSGTWPSDSFIQPVGTVQLA